MGIQASRVEVLLGVGGQDPLPVFTGSLNGSNGGHVLNQLWWVGEVDVSNGLGFQRVLTTAETGWIYSAYFTEELSLTAFAYSTPNQYGVLGKDCNASSAGGNPNQYNHLGGFVYT